MFRGVKTARNLTKWWHGHMMENYEIIFKVLTVVQFMNKGWIRNNQSKIKTSPLNPTINHGKHISFLIFRWSSFLPQRLQLGFKGLEFTLTQILVCGLLLFFFSAKNVFKVKDVTVMLKFGASLQKKKHRLFKL